VGPHGAGSAAEQLRTAEVIGTLCLATDLGMGFPFEHGLHTTVIAMRLADRLGVDRQTAVQTYYGSLLSHAGCTTDAHLAAEVFGGSLTEHLNPLMYGSSREVMTGLIRALPDPGASGPARAAQIAQRLPRMVRSSRPAIAANCEVAGMLAEQTGAPAGVAASLAYLTDRWDGKGPLRRAVADAIPLSMRIVHVAIDAALQRHLAGEEFAARLIGEHAGRGLDPEVAGCVAADAPGLLSFTDGSSVWEEALAAEPRPWLTLAGEQVDRALAAMGRFADLICPYHSGHSRGVAELAAAAAARCGMDAAGTRTVRHAGLVHDLGRVAVSAATWGKPGPLSADEWEQVRLHPYRTERVLSRAAFLADLTPVACAHHERLDRSGYHRGMPAAELTMPARLLAAADMFHTKCEQRPHRAGMSAGQAAQALAAEAKAGRLDPDAVAAVAESAGQRVPRLDRPNGLTDREGQVLALLARGLLTKQVAKALGISVKTADRHVQNIYAKIGVSSRAAATMFAMEHGLVTWGESPMEDASGRS
jgi:response regulator RpfG family c-di-GMP phosphodiesterase/DNA-binding CsgD family transcriptional regulator